LYCLETTSPYERDSCENERLAKLAIERALKRLKVASETFGTPKPRRNPDELIFSFECPALKGGDAVNNPTVIKQESNPFLKPKNHTII